VWPRRCWTLRRKRAPVSPARLGSDDRRFLDGPADLAITVSGSEPGMELGHGVFIGKAYAHFTMSFARLQ
jgi:hypothetical protein